MATCVECGRHIRKGTASPASRQPLHPSCVGAFMQRIDEREFGWRITVDPPDRPMTNPFPITRQRARAMGLR